MRQEGSKILWDSASARAEFGSSGALSSSEQLRIKKNVRTHSFGLTKGTRASRVGQ